MIVNDHSDPRTVFLQVHVGGDRNFCYLAGDRASGEAAAFDPAFDPDRLEELARERELRIRHILITHGHPDHAGGAARLAERTGASFHAGAADRVRGAEPVSDGARFPLGSREIHALHTPGHSPGHTCYLFEGRLVTGDLLFCGKVGGTGEHFPGSSAAQEWESLHRLLELGDGTRVFPGHDYYGGEGAMPDSTIGHERRHNPFLLCRDLDEFRQLKDGWAEYKKRNGIR